MIQKLKFWILGLVLPLLLLLACGKFDSQDVTNTNVLDELPKAALEHLQSLSFKWDNMSSRIEGDCNVTELPLEKVDNPLIIKVDGTQDIAQIKNEIARSPDIQKNISEQSMSLFIYERAGKPKEYRLAHFIPEISASSKTSKPGLYPEKTDFSGQIWLTSIHNQKKTGAFFKNGVMIDPPLKNGVNERGDCGQVWTTFQVFDFINGITYTVEGFLFVPCPKISYFIPATIEPLGGGGGGGGIYGGHHIVGFPIPPAVSDLGSDLSCMTTNNPLNLINFKYKVGIYVKQPVPGTPGTFAYVSFPSRVTYGQTYLYLERKGYTPSGDSLTEAITLYYRPDTAFLGTFHPYSYDHFGRVSIMNSPTLCDVAAVYDNVSYTTFVRIISRVNNYIGTVPALRQYHLHNYNSTDFVLYVVNPLASNLPASGISLDGFQTNCAGVLGESIRLLPNSVNVTNTPPREGFCL
jgi:hypothetical protein